jgi:hypothetical protein
MRVSLGKPSALSTNVVSPGVRGHNPSSLFFSESISFSFHQGYEYLRKKKRSTMKIQDKIEMRKQSLLKTVI